MTDTAAPSVNRAEFIGLMAMMSAIIAYSIDAMLPAVGVIGAELAPGATQTAAMVIPAFVFGLGLGTLFVGPLSDAFGRRPLVLAGLCLFGTGAVLASFATSLPMLLAARVLMGLGAAGPRVVSLAIVRDVSSGPDMARIMSLVMTVFMVVPAVAPAIGALIISGVGWRGVFWSCLGFAAIAGTWFGLRQAETLADAARRPFRTALLLSGIAEVLRESTARQSILAQTAVFGALFGTLSSIQPIFAGEFGREAAFPAWFAVISVIAAAFSFTNALIVRRVGMIGMVRGMLVVQIAFAGIVALLTLMNLWPAGPFFPVTFLWLSSVFVMASLTMGNLSAIGMGRLGHMAGMAASVMLAASTIGGALIAAVITLLAGGTAGLLALAVMLCAVVALLAVSRRRPSAL
jgi:MFS transporter, DHA1 family, multidrug resistance protein